jgi:hypothetical protein
MHKSREVLKRRNAAAAIGLNPIPSLNVDDLYIFKLTGHVISSRCKAKQSVFFTSL